MIIISYNCRGFNDIKARYIRKLTEDFHIIFCVEHWILQNKLHILNKGAPNFNIFATSGMIENKLILGRRYGGCSVFINKSIKCTSRLLDYVTADDYVQYYQHFKIIRYYLLQFICLLIYHVILLNLILF